MSWRQINNKRTRLSKIGSNSISLVDHVSRAMGLKHAARQLCCWVRTISALIMVEAAVLVFMPRVFRAKSSTC